MSELFRHISFTQLIDFYEARLTPQEQESVRVHLAGCPFCQSELAWLKRVIRLMRSDQSEDAPQQFIFDAFTLFNLRPVTTPSRQRPRVQAVLLFDSARQPFVVGIRTLSFDVRQLLFSAAGREIDMRIIPSGALWIVWGQLLGSEEIGTVELQDADSSVQTTLNTLNEFSLPPVQSGTYTLTIALNDVELEIADMQIGL